jgi:thioredoxin 1
MSARPEIPHAAILAEALASFPDLRARSQSEGRCPGGRSAPSAAVASPASAPSGSRRPAAAAIEAGSGPPVPSIGSTIATGIALTAPATTPFARARFIAFAFSIFGECVYNSAMRRALAFLSLYVLISCSSQDQQQVLKGKAVQAKPVEPPDGGRSDMEQADAGGTPVGGIMEASGRPMLLDFTRDNCLPCRIMDPWIREIRKKYSGRAEVVEINIDRPENETLEKFFKIRSVPAQIYLDAAGRQRLRHDGLATLKEMQKVMQQLL